MSAAAIAILFAPPVPRGEEVIHCANSRAVAPRLNLTVNCDSWLFVALAQDPSGMFSGKGIERQSRPLAVVIGTITALPFRFVNWLAGNFGFGYEPRIDYHLGFILINWLTLIGSVIGFTRLAKSNTVLEPWFAIPLSMLLVNLITKPFFWTAHVQLFSVAIPLLSVAVASTIWTLRGNIPIRGACLMGLLLGIAALAYGAFVLPLAAAAVAVLVRPSTETGTRRVGTVAVAVVSFAIPGMTWRQFVLHETGDFYAHETRFYRQFVWIGDALAEGVNSFGAMLSRHLNDFASTLAPAVGLAVLGLSCALLAAIYLKVDLRELVRSPVIAGVTSYVVVALPFYALMGFYTPRLTWAIAPALLLAFAIMSREAWTRLPARQQQRVAPVLLILAISYAGWTILTPGPFS